MRKLLYRYLAADMMVPCFAWMAGLVLMLIGNFMFLLLKNAQGRPLPWDATVRYLAFRVPFAVMMSLPMALLFATALSLNRLSRENELIAMRMGGMSPRRVMAPYLLVSVACFVAAHLIYDRVMPYTNHVSDNAVRSIFLQQADIRPSAQFFVQPPDSDYVFYSRGADKEAGVLRDVMLCKLHPRAFPEFTVAETAQLKGNVWTLTNARNYRFDEAGFVQSCGVWESTQIDLKEILERYWEAQRSPEEQSMADLRERIATKREGRQPFSVEATELHSKVSLPLACVVFALVIGPLAVRYSRGSFTGMLLASIALFVYYLLLSWGKVLAQGGGVSPIVCAWAHDAVFGLVGIVLFIRMR